MTVLFLGDIAADVGASGLSDDSVTTAAFDSAYSLGCISALNSVGNGAASPNITLGGSLMSAPTTSFWLHWHLYKLNFDSYTGGGYVTYLSLKNPSGVEVARVEAYQNGANQFRVVAVGDTTVNSANVVCAPSGKADYDVVVTGGSTMVISLYKNGVLQATASAANTTGAKAIPKSFYFTHAGCWQSNSTTNVIAYSEIIATDGESTIGWRLSTQKPNAAGNYSAWTGNYSQLGDLNAATAAASGIAAQRVSSALSAYAGPASPTSIRGVFGKSLGSKGASGPQHLNQFLRISGANYDGGAVIPDGVSQMIQEWAVNPATSAVWATTDLSGLELGLLSAT
jgi:hypothetical protein